MADPAPKKGKVMAPNPTMMTPRSAPVISFEFAQIWRDVLNNKPDITAVSWIMIVRFLHIADTPVSGTSNWVRRGKQHPPPAIVPKVF